MASFLQEGLKVECYSGSRWCEHPSKVWLGGRKFFVVKWMPIARTPNSLSFEVELENGMRLKLIYETEEKVWKAVSLS